ncbi:MAG: ubiquitin-like domain-containing protein [Promethearchaeota archaeon]
MSEDSHSEGSEEPEFLSRLYNCPKCRIIHTVKIPKDIAKEKPSFPFPFVFLHSATENLEDLLTILYIDAQLQIRAVEVIEVDNSNIFSEELTKQIAEKLMDKIVSLEEENLQLKELLRKLEVDKLSEIETQNPKVLSIPTIKLEPQVDKVKEILSKKPLIDINEVKTSEIQSKDAVPELAEIDTTINVFIISTIGPGEKKQDLKIDLKNNIGDLKETVGNLYGLQPANFHLSSGGLTLDENLDIGDYNVEDGDDILIIPSSTAGFKLNIKNRLILEFDHYHKL